MEKILADNVTALLTARNLSHAALAKLTKGKLNQTTISRIAKARHKVQIDTVEALAEAFEVEPYQLLIPGLNARNPQVLRSLSPAEERLYKALEEARKPGTQ